MKILILYSSYDGQTQRISARIAQHLQTLADCHLADLRASQTPDLNGYAAVIIGASIRYGRFHVSLNDFVTQWLQQLTQLPTAFFSVNLTARKAGKNTPQTNIYTQKFLQHSPWQPNLCQVFAGALCYPRYRWFDRWMIRLIMAITGGETDPRTEIDYTDWAEVERFAEQIRQLVVQRSV